MAFSRNVLIAGAGIGGLSAALMLAQNGFRVTLLEQAERLEETGAGIQLSPNATRIMIDLGKREQTVGILNQICDLLDAGMSWALDEPILALSDDDAAWPGAASDAKWVLATVLAQRENWRAFSSYFTGQESLPALREARTLGYAGESVERRIGLIESRFGLAG